MNKVKERPLCVVEDCKNVAMKMARRNDGSWSYRRMCSKHHRVKYNMKNGHHDKRYDRNKEGLGDWTKKSCQRCGWNKSYCDLHRIVNGKDGGLYTLDNVEILCPNCHRIEHRGNF